MTYQFALIESIVMGSVIALTDILLRPGVESKGNLEQIFLYLAQAVITGVVYQAQVGSSMFGCPDKATQKRESAGSHKKMLKVIFGAGLLFITDAVLRPMHVNNLWMQGVKFVIQGSLIFHMYKHDWSDSFSS